MKTKIQKNGLIDQIFDEDLDTDSIEESIIQYNREVDEIISSLSFYDEVSKQGVDYNEFNFTSY